MTEMIKCPGCGETVADFRQHKIECLRDWTPGSLAFSIACPEPKIGYGVLRQVQRHADAVERLTQAARAVVTTSTDERWEGIHVYDPQWSDFLAALKAVEEWVP